MNLKITATNLDAYDLFHKGIQALARVERAGLYLDIPYCEKVSKHLDRQIEHIRKNLMESDLVTRWRRAFGRNFNMDSNPQLAEVLFGHMGVKPSKFTGSSCRMCKGKGCSFCDNTGDNPSVDEEALDAIDVDEVQDLLRIRRLGKVKDTYLASLMREQVDGIIHPNFNLHIAATFRPSTDSPNLANIPNRNPEIKKLVRRAIKPRPGHKIIAADFKGIEVGIACGYHHDPNMIEYVADKTKDMHRDMAMKLYLLTKEQVNKHIRHSGKNEYVFPEFYGDYWRNCARNLWHSSLKPTHVLPDGTQLRDHLIAQGLRDLEDFECHVESVEDWMWNKKWAKYTAWKEAWLKQYHKQGYFDTLTGFRCQGVMSRNQVINYPVQGSAFHCLLQCIIWLDEDSMKEGWDSRVCNQIYDDVMLDVHPDEEQMVLDRLNYYMKERLPAHWDWINVPLDVEIEATPVDGTWYDKSEDWVLKVA